MLTAPVPPPYASERNNEMADKQHRERIEELRKDIETGVKELRNSGTWQRYLDFMGVSAVLL